MSRKSNFRFISFFDNNMNNQIIIEMHIYLEFDNTWRIINKERYFEMINWWIFKLFDLIFTKMILVVHPKFVNLWHFHFVWFSSIVNPYCAIWIILKCNHHTVSYFWSTEKPLNYFKLRYKVLERVARDFFYYIKSLNLTCYTFSDNFGKFHLRLYCNNVHEILH